MNFDKLTKELKVDTQEFAFQFQSHPNYPSALAFSDTLNFLGVKNDAYELQKEFWKDLPEEFIAIYSENFVLVKKQVKGYAIFSDKEERISESQLLEESENFVLLFEKPQEKERRKLHFSYFLYAFFLISLLYSVFTQSWDAVAFNVLSMLGLYISLEIFQKKFGKESVVLNNFCSSPAKSSKPESCTKIIDSDTINILGLKLSDFSLAYFSALLILGLFIPYIGGVLKIVSFGSTLVICYSLFVQIFVEKAFCKICLFIIAVLAGQITISAWIFNFEIPVSVAILSVIVFFISFFGLVFVNDLTAQKENYRKSDIKNLRFKRNYDIFRKQLIEKERVYFRHTNLFRLGSSDAKMNISLVSNPYCGYCKDAHKVVEKLLQKYPDDVSVQIRFNYFEGNGQEEYKNLLRDFLNIITVKNEKIFLQTIELWFHNKNEHEIHSKYNSAGNEYDLEEVLKVSQENRNYGFTFTPLFLINGYQFPDKYDKEDIFYFIDELLEDEEIVSL